MDIWTFQNLRFRGGLMLTHTHIPTTARHVLPKCSFEVQSLDAVRISFPRMESPWRSTCSLVLKTMPVLRLVANSNLSLAQNFLSDS